MEVDRDVQKRLIMDTTWDGTVVTPSKATVVLAITDGTGIDLKENNSPTSSSSSNKRLKLSKITETNVISAASLEEDRRTQ